METMDHALLQSPEEQTVILYGISWETYERLLEEREDHARLAYDRGRLEIVSPRLSEHERYKSDIEVVVGILALETGISIESVGETTFRSRALQAGFEPDNSFYIQHESQVRGNDRIDLRMDPPPDLVVEIDITSPSLDKFPMYASLGMPEVWRLYKPPSEGIEHDRVHLELLVLEGKSYAANAQSRVLPGVTASALNELLDTRRRMARTEWLTRVREWALKLRSL